MKDHFLEIFIVFCILALIGICTWMGVKEVRVFNECTGSHLSVWDGFWVEKRILDCKGAK